MTVSMPTLRLASQRSVRGRPRRPRGTDPDGLAGIRGSVGFGGLGAIKKVERLWSWGTSGNSIEALVKRFAVCELVPNHIVTAPLLRHLGYVVALGTPGLLHHKHAGDQSLDHSFSQLELRLDADQQAEGIEVHGACIHSDVLHDGCLERPQQHVANLTVL
jgi:hypothetical protein